jgi:nitrogen regulatory protein PII
LIRDGSFIPADGPPLIFLFAGSFFLKKVAKAYRVRMVTCLIRPEQLQELTSALSDQKLMMGMTVTDVRGFGRQMGSSGDTSPPDDRIIRYLPKLKLEILVRNKDSNQVMDAIVKCLRTGEIGDGKIIVYDAAHLMRIRTGEKGLSALY